MIASKPTRVLIVDDNRDIHEDFRKILARVSEEQATDAAEAAFFGEDAERTETRGPRYELDDAYQGQEALQLVIDACDRGEPYAFAFVDMRMPPGWDGIETIERLWSADPELLVVVCTAYSDYSWSDMVDRLGVNDKVLLLKKPFDNAEVQQIALALAEKRRLANLAVVRVDKLEQLVAERTASLRDAHLESEQLLNAISSLLVGVDVTGRVYRWNATAAEVFATTAERAVGRKLLDLGIDWSDPTPVRELLESGGDEERSINVGFTHATHGYRLLELTAHTVYSGESRLGSLLLGVDITEKKTLEQQLLNAQKLESVGQLAAGVAHEINTPMQYLGDNLDYLDNKISKTAPLLEAYDTVLSLAKASGEEPQLISDIQEKLRKLKVKSFIKQVPGAIADSRDGVKHVSRIVRAMKELSHPGQDQRSPLDVNNALESAVAVSTNEWKYVADVDLQLDDSLPFICAYAGELSQVFLNILVNAAHAIGDTNDGGSGPKGTISIRTYSTDTHVTVLIGDTGTGMSDDVKQRIFDPFFTTKEVGKGTGQGLAIAHSVVVQKHGGTLSCDSTPGEGTTFVLELPIEDQSEQTGSAEVAAHSA